MNVIAKPGMSVAQFLAWERAQPLAHEFDGERPIPMNGASVAHARLVRRLMAELTRQLPAEYEAFGGALKVLTPNRVRYPDVIVSWAAPDATDDVIARPLVLFEILSPSTAAIDLRAKPAEYAAIESLCAYVTLPQDTADGALLRRRAADWRPEPVHDRLDLPDIRVTLLLRTIYAT